MTVAELIVLLGDFDGKSEVYFAHPSHDYWRSELASPVKDAGYERVKHSQYHNQMTTTDDDGTDVVILRY